MELGANYHITKTCRLCLSNQPSVFLSIFENNIALMIEALASKKVSPCDTLTMVCLKCSLNLKLAYHFQQKIKKSEEKLRESTYIKQEPYTLQLESVTINEEGDVKVDRNVSNDFGQICDNKCPICGVQLDDNMVNDHIREHFNNEQRCDSCDTSFANIESYKQHLLEHHERVVFQCNNCKVKFYYKSLYNIHTKTVCFINKNVQKHIIAALDLLKKEKEDRSTQILREINSEEAKTPCLLDEADNRKDTKQSTLRSSTINATPNKENSEINTCTIEIKEKRFPLFAEVNNEDGKCTSLKLATSQHLQQPEKIDGNSNYTKKVSSVNKSRLHTKEKTNKRSRVLDKVGEDTKGQVPKRRLRSNAVPGITCTQCSKCFSSIETLLKHMYTHRTRKCNTCNRYISQQSYSNHVKNHTHRPQMCHLCGAILKNNRCLSSHIRCRHKKPGYKCNECGKLSRTKGERDSHRKRDHSWKPTFCCETCGKCFYAKKYLQKHVNVTHLKLRPHICEFCNKGYSSRYAMRTHTRQHTNETPFKCEVCGEGYRHNVSLKAHMKSKHEIEEPKTCKCQVCGKGFASETSLHAHKRVHWV